MASWTAQALSQTSRIFVVSRHNDCTLLSNTDSILGNEKTRAKFEKLARRRLTGHDVLSLLQPPQETPKLAVKHESDDDIQHYAKPRKAHDFFKNRPQFGLHKESPKSSGQTKVKVETDQNDIATDPPTLIPNTRFEGHQAAWQHDETVLAFLRRLPVSSPATALAGPWLWVSPPLYHPSWTAADEEADLDTFRSAATTLLADFREHRSLVESQNAGKPAATITRKMNPHREDLKHSLLSAAQEFHITSGKWMLFPSLSDLPRIWRLVAEHTAAGKLGPVSKVATYEPENEKKGTLICVYTYDFNDYSDVRRVLLELLGLEVFGCEGRQVYYKCDAYTYLGIGSQNEFKLSASVYASAEVLEKVEGGRPGGASGAMAGRKRQKEGKKGKRDETTEGGVASGGSGKQSEVVGEWAF